MTQSRPISGTQKRVRPIAGNQYARDIVNHRAPGGGMQPDAGSIEAGELKCLHSVATDGRRCGTESAFPLNQWLLYSGKCR